MSTKWTTPTTASTIVNAQTITTGNTYTTAEVDNETDKYPYLALLGSYSFASAPTAGKSLLFYLDFEGDGGYENDTEEARLVGSITLDADTSTHYFKFPDIQCPPSGFKLIVENNDDADTVTITVKERRYSVEDVS